MVVLMAPSAGLGRTLRDALQCLAHFLAVLGRTLRSYCDNYQECDPVVDRFEALLQSHQKEMIEIMETCPSPHFHLLDDDLHVLPNQGSDCVTQSAFQLDNGDDALTLHSIQYSRTDVIMKLDIQYTGTEVSIQADIQYIRTDVKMQAEPVQPLATWFSHHPVALRWHTLPTGKSDSSHIDDCKADSRHKDGHSNKVMANDDETYGIAPLHQIEAPSLNVSNETQQCCFDNTVLPEAEPYAHGPYACDVLTTAGGACGSTNLGRSGHKGPTVPLESKALPMKGGRRSELLCI